MVYDPTLFSPFFLETGFVLRLIMKRMVLGTILLLGERKDGVIRILSIGGVPLHTMLALDASVIQTDRR